MKRATVLWVMLLGLLLAGCNDKSDSAGETAGDSPKPTRESPGSSESTSTSEWKVKSNDGTVVARFEVSGDKSLTGRMKSGKRKYDTPDGQLKVKLDGDKIKLKDADGKLLWKIKIDGDKIKIGADEELTDPYVLKRKGADRVKVKKGEEEIGKVTFAEGKLKVKDQSGAERFYTKTSAIAPRYGVLLMSDIPEVQRYIVMAELSARGQ